MAEFIFVYLVFEEGFHPWPGDKFHGHGMNFTGFVGWPDDLRTLDPAGAEDLEGVAGFMGQNINICTGSIEVGKDKGTLVVRNVGAIATCVLALLGQQIQQLMFHHEIKELAGFR